MSGAFLIDKSYRCTQNQNVLLVFLALTSRHQIQSIGIDSKARNGIEMGHHGVDCFSCRENKLQSISALEILMLSTIEQSGDDESPLVAVS